MIRADGLGWLMDYVCRLWKTFPSLTREAIFWELPMVQGWAYFGWAIENDGWMAFSGLTRQGSGYVGEEVKRILEQNGKGKR